MKIEVVIRTNRTEFKNGVQSYVSQSEFVEVESAEELFNIYKPLKQSENLKKAVEDLINGKRTKVEYNFGKGNALFINR